MKTITHLLLLAALFPWTAEQDTTNHLIENPSPKSCKSDEISRMLSVNTMYANRE